MLLTLLQSALATTPSSAVKRQAPAEFDEPDTENIDPINLFSDSSKKAKTFSFDSSKLIKAPRYTLNVTPANTPVKRGSLSSAAGTKRKAPTNTSPVYHPTPSSASVPSAAGRSPKHKRVGILSKRRCTTTPHNHITRIDPPSFSSPKVTQPFSIDAALNGTVPTPTRVSKSKASRKGWHFAIHEDTQDEEMANLMEHSTQTLEISDDDEAGSGRSSSPSKGDRCNKENVAPADYQPAATTTSRRDMMLDEARSPLGDLRAKDYYAEGCDASSVIIIPAEEELEDESFVEKMAKVAEGPFSPTTNKGVSGWESLLAQMSSNNKTAGHDLLGEAVDDEDAKTEIQIWESESAKDEAEAIDEAHAAAAKVVVRVTA